MTLPTQAAITRAVKAAVQGFQAATGRIATGVKVTFAQGLPAVEVTASAESPSPAPIVMGGQDVETLKKRMRGCHAG